MFTFALLCGTIRPSRCFGMEPFAGWEIVENLPMLLIVEDDVLIQTMVEEALKEAGFETAIAPSAEEAVTLIKGKSRAIGRSSRTSI
jgi:PleD family two-component response regulator